MSPKLHVILRLQEPPGENDELGRRSLQPVIAEPFDATDLWLWRPFAAADRRPQCGKLCESPDIVGPLRSRDIDKSPRSSKLGGIGDGVRLLTALWADDSFSRRWTKRRSVHANLQTVERVSLVPAFTKAFSG
jgi:hypothetical protein